jgi:hypothetical protein
MLQKQALELFLFPLPSTLVLSCGARMINNHTLCNERFEFDEMGAQWQRFNLVACCFLQSNPNVVVSMYPQNLKAGSPLSSQKKCAEGLKNKKQSAYKHHSAHVYRNIFYIYYIYIYAEVTLEGLRETNVGNEWK